MTEMEWSSSCLSILEDVFTTHVNRVNDLDAICRSWREFYKNVDEIWESSVVRVSSHFNGDHH